MIDCLYIKSGDVLRELDEIRKGKDIVLNRGPLIYMYQFLKVMKKNSIVIGPGVNISNNPIEDKNRKVRIVPVGGQSMPKKMYCVIKEIVRSKPKYVLCGEKNLMLLSAFFGSKIVNSKVIFTAHNDLSSSSDGLMDKLMSLINRYCIKYVDACLCHGPFLESQLNNIRESESGIFPFERGGYGKLDENRIKNSTKKTVLYVGRIEVGKGVFDLLDAVESLLKSDSNTELIYVGGGNSLDRLKSKVEARGLSDQVSVVGPVSHSSLDEYYSEADLVVTPTRSSFPEGRCMVAVESMFYRIPVVAPDNGPFPFIVKHGQNGLLYTVNNVESLNKSIYKIIDDDEFRKALSDGTIGFVENYINNDAFSEALVKSMNYLDAGSANA